MSFKVNPRESLARSHDYDNKFRVYPEEARLKETRRTRALDVIEPESDRLERQMTEKLSKGFFNHQGTNTQYLKKVGKFVFVAVITPPYILTIALPKLIFQYALPFALNLAGGLFNKLNSALNVIITPAQAVMSMIAIAFSKIFRLLFTKTNKAEKSTKDNILTKFRRGARFLFKRARQSVAFIANKAESSLKTIVKTLNPIFRLIGSFFAVLFKWLVKILKPLALLALPVQKSYSGLKWLVARETHKKFISYLNNNLKNLPEKIKAIVALVNSTVNRVLSFVKAVFRVVVYIKLIVVALASFFWEILCYNYQRWIEPHTRWIAPFIKAAGNKVKVLGNRLKNIYEYVTQLSKNLFLKVGRACQAIYLKLAQLATKVVNALLSRVGRFFQLALNAITHIIMAAKSISDVMVLAIRKLALSFYRGLAFVLHTLKKAPTSSIRFLDLSAKFMIKGVRFSFKKVWEGYLFTKVICKLLFKEALKTLDKI